MDEDKVFFVEDDVLAQKTREELSRLQEEYSDYKDGKKQSSLIFTEIDLAEEKIMLLETLLDKAEYNCIKEMVYCRDCIHGGQEFCCGGCDQPSDMPLGSCLHYKVKV